MPERKCTLFYKHYWSLLLRSCLYKKENHADLIGFLWELHRNTPDLIYMVIWVNSMVVQNTLCKAIGFWTSSVWEILNWKQIVTFSNAQYSGIHYILYCSLDKISSHSLLDALWLCLEHIMTLWLRLLMGINVLLLFIFMVYL